MKYNSLGACYDHKHNILLLRLRWISGHILGEINVENQLIPNNVIYLFLPLWLHIKLTCDIASIAYLKLK